MDDSHDDRHFHLQRVRENEDVVCSVPFGVQTHEVGLSSRDGLDGTRTEIGRPPETGWEDSEGEGEDIVVEETGVDREETHQENDVSSVVERIEDLQQRPSSVSMIGETEEAECRTYL